MHSYGNAGNKFAGWEALTISGDTAVVGSANEGLAHIYQRADVVWFEQATLSPVGGAAANETFGTSASIIDNVAVIGSVKELRAPISNGASVSPTSTGAAYVFRRSCEVWTQVATLEPPPSEPLGDQFGRAVTLSPSGTVIVSADSVATDRDGIPAVDHGAADIFDLPSDFLAQDACAKDCAGSSAALPRTLWTCARSAQPTSNALWTLCSPQRNSAYFISARPPQLPRPPSPPSPPPPPPPPPRARVSP